jgi:hypothetical protein
MLDPMNATNLASSIAQLIDFSTKLLKDANDIRNKGSSVNVQHLKTLTLDLISLGEAVRERQRPQGLSDGNPLTREVEVSLATHWNYSPLAN